MDFPKNITWLVTSRCNMKCKHCYTNSSDVIGSNELSSHQMTRAAEIILGLKPRRIYLSGGEPLMRNGIFELIHTITESGSEVQICTNGSLLDSATVRRLKRAGTCGVVLSFDSPDCDEFDSYRGYGSAFQKAARAIGNCLHERLEIRCETTVSRLNFRKLERIVDLLTNLGIKELTFKRFRPVGRGKQNVSELSLKPNENFEALLWVYRKSRQLRDSLTIRVHDPLYSLIAYYDILATRKSVSLKDLCTVLNSDGIGCLAGSFWVGILPNGDMTPCPLLNIAVGNIFEGNIYETWQNSRVVRNIISMRGNSIMDSLGVGCRTEAFSSTGNYLGADPMLSCDEYIRWRGQTHRQGN